MKTLTLSLPVSVPDNITDAEALRLVKKLIDVGLADAQETVDNPDVEEKSDAATVVKFDFSESLVPPGVTRSSVMVAYWNTYPHPNDDNAAGNFTMKTDDQRARNGQFFLDLVGDASNTDDILSVSAEISRIPGSTQDTQSLIIHFDDNAVAVILYKHGNQIVLQTETQVDLEPLQLPNGEAGWVLKRQYQP